MKRSITGRLVTIKFDERKLSILYKPASRELDCIYDEAVEPFLLQHPRELISVTGQVVLDEQNQPRRIVDVDEIVDVDLSQFFLSRFDYPHHALSFKEEMLIEPELDESEQLMVLRHEPLGIDVVGTTREDLYQGLLDDLDVLWRNYARAEDAVLSPRALGLKRRLLEAIEERSLAAR